jgi:hypothetical protein
MKNTLSLLIILTLSACCGFASSPSSGEDTDTDTDAGTGADTSTGPGPADGTGSAGGLSGSDSGPDASTSSSSTSAGDEGSSSTGLGSEEDSGSSSGDSSACEVNADCMTDEVCAALECVDAWSVPHSVRMTAWDEPCDGAGTNMFFFQAGAFESSTVSCPQAWPGDWFTVAAGGTSLVFDFFELGGSPNPDQFITTWCWDKGMGCGPVPKEDLHAGEAAVAWGSWHAAIEFAVVE